MCSEVNTSSYSGRSTSIPTAWVNRHLNYETGDKHSGFVKYAKPPQCLKKSSQTVSHPVYLSSCWLLCFFKYLSKIIFNYVTCFNYDTSKLKCWLRREFCIHNLGKDFVLLRLLLGLNNWESLWSSGSNLPDLMLPAQYTFLLRLLLSSLPRAIPLCGILLMVRKWIKSLLARQFYQTTKRNN